MSASAAAVSDGRHSTIRRLWISRLRSMLARRMLLVMAAAFVSVSGMEWVLTNSSRQQLVGNNHSRFEREGFAIQRATPKGDSPVANRSDVDAEVSRSLHQSSMSCRVLANSISIVQPLHRRNLVMSPAITGSSQTRTSADPFPQRREPSHRLESYR